jgi:divalent metal cation (Fe/Co/Zn/Cd) transporter
MPVEPVPSDGDNRPHLIAALRVSVVSVVWTLASSVLAVSIGINNHTTVLIAFGAVGIVDAIGSVTLSYHFAHGLRHEQLSEKVEGVAHRIVLTGLLCVGAAAIVGGATRLAAAQHSSSTSAGVVLAGASFVVLLLLSFRKQRVAQRVSSNALRSDGQLSAVGAMMAFVTLAGTVVERWFGWSWADAWATIAVGSGAVVLAIATWMGEHSTEK